MQLTLSVLALITVAHGGYVLLHSVTDLSDAISDNEKSMVAGLKDMGRHAGLASLAAVEFMAGVCLLVMQWI